MENGAKKREWVKDAAIIFLAVLLVLTFFSNTIMNRSLPEVATAAVTNGSIIARVRGTGTVVATGKQQVKAKETRTIRAVMIKVGQPVNVGDVLFVLGEGDETLLEQAEEKLRTLQASYNRQALNVPTLNYSSYNRAIENAEAKLSRATDARIAAWEKLERMETDPITEAAWMRYQAAEEVLREMEAEYENNFAERRSELEYRIAQLDLEIDSIESTPEYQQLNDEVYYAQMAYDDSDQEAIWWEREMNDAQADVDMRRNLVQLPYDEELQPVLERYDEAKDQYEYYRYLASSAEADLNDAIARRDSLVSDRIAARDNLQSELDSLDEDAYYERVREQREKVDQYYSDYSALAGNLDDEYQDALYAEEDARVALDAAYQDLYYAQEDNARSIGVSQAELAEIAEQIRVQQEKIRSLAGEDENVISATASGTVDTIDCTAGDTVVKDSILCTIEVPDMGHTLSFSVTNDQAQRLRIGDTATVSNYYWGNSVTATLTNIRTDPKNPQTNKILTFDLTGDVSSGAEMTISVGQKSANYDLIVPNSAVKSDSNGSFVLVVTVKNSPLGNRYIARRVSVQILASDDNNSALVADLSNGDYVITTSSAPVSSGDMVRITDKG